jgi:hypothetical protein
MFGQGFDSPQLHGIFKPLIFSGFFVDRRRGIEPDPFLIANSFPLNCYLSQDLVCAIAKIVGC